MLAAVSPCTQSHAFGIVFRKPRRRGVSIGENLEVIWVSDLRAVLVSK